MKAVTAEFFQGIEILFYFGMKANLYTSAISQLDPLYNIIKPAPLLKYYYTPVLTFRYLRFVIFSYIIPTIKKVILTPRIPKAS